LQACWDRSPQHMYPRRPLSLLRASVQRDTSRKRPVVSVQALSFILPIILYSQGSSASIPSQPRMHGCVVIASSATSLPCKRAGRRASSGISFSDAVQQSQLSYPKSARLCRLLEAFEGFGCRSSRQPQLFWMSGILANDQ